MCRVLNILSALLSRFLFAVHGVLTVWRVVEVTGEASYWLLVMGVALLGVEMAITVKYTRKAEWRWLPRVQILIFKVLSSKWSECGYYCNTSRRRRMQGEGKRRRKVKKGE